MIYHIETYDVTTIRASTPMYLLARVMESMGGSIDIHSVHGKGATVVLRFKAG